MLKIAFDKSYKHPLGKNHRFPMIKYELIPEQLLRKNICLENSFFAPDEILKENAILANRKYDSYSSDPSSVIDSLIKYTLDRI